MNRIVHFEVPADDPERAVKFYENVFGWKIKKWDNPVEYWLVLTGPESESGIDGGIYRRDNPVKDAGPLNAFRCTVDTTDLDLTIKKVKKNGGKIIQEKTVIPGIGWMAMCLDTEGNHFGLMESDENAGK